MCFERFECFTACRKSEMMRMSSPLFHLVSMVPQFADVCSSSVWPCLSAWGVSLSNTNLTAVGSIKACCDSRVRSWWGYSIAPSKENMLAPKHFIHNRRLVPQQDACKSIRISSIQFLKLDIPLVSLSNLNHPLIWFMVWNMFFP